jgi:hypothetical protein
MIGARQKNKISPKYCVIIPFSVNRAVCRGVTISFVNSLLTEKERASSNTVAKLIINFD